jgi:hypothetical protein
VNAVTERVALRQDGPDLFAGLSGLSSLSGLAADGRESLAVGLRRLVEGLEKRTDLDSLCVAEGKLIGQPVQVSQVPRPGSLVRLAEKAISAASSRAGSGVGARASLHATATKEVKRARVVFLIFGSG